MQTIIFSGILISSVLFDWAHADEGDPLDIPAFDELDRSVVNATLNARGIGGFSIRGLSGGRVSSNVDGASAADSFGIGSLSNVDRNVADVDMRRPVHAIAPTATRESFAAVTNIIDRRYFDGMSSTEFLSIRSTSVVTAPSSARGSLSSAPCVNDMHRVPADHPTVKSSRCRRDAKRAAFLGGNFR